jgi:FtsZ-binding cell division protein ZapB
MTNSKLQAAIDEIQRLADTVKEFKKRNGKLPDTDSDAGRALYSLEMFFIELKKLNITHGSDLSF